MRRFLLDTGIAGDFVDRRRGVFERAQSEVARGNRIGIGIPVLAEFSTPPTRPDLRHSSITLRLRSRRDLCSNSHDLACGTSIAEVA